jgi:hypothetical protein
MLCGMPKAIGFVGVVLIELHGVIFFPFSGVDGAAGENAGKKEGGGEEGKLHGHGSLIDLF